MIVAEAKPVTDVKTHRFVFLCVFTKEKKTTLVSIYKIAIIKPWQRASAPLETDDVHLFLLQ